MERTYTCSICKAPRYHKDDTYHLSRNGERVSVVSINEADLHICAWCMRDLGGIAKAEQTHKEVSAKGGRAKSEAKTASSRRNASAKRFSKKRFLDYLCDLSRPLQEEWSIDGNIGYAQVTGGVPAHKAYGQFNALEELIDEVFSGEIKPFSKKSLLEWIEHSLKYARTEDEADDIGSKARSGGVVSILVKIMKDIEAKVM